MIGMTATHLEPLLRAAERRAVARVLRSHPEWTLGDVVAYIDKNGPRAAVLRGLALRELLEGHACATDGGPPIDVDILARAKRATGAEFDQLVREVLASAGRPVSARYLRARLGGPRWKLLTALNRLLHRRVIERSGITSATRYWIAGGSEAPQ